MLESICIPMEAAMGSFKRPHAFDPLDMEIIDLVYEFAWEQLSANEPARDMAQDEERQASLRKQVFALAGNGAGAFCLWGRMDALLAQLE